MPNFAKWLHLLNGLLQAGAVGIERTFEPDPMFAFRITVDIASASAATER